MNRVNVFSLMLNVVRDRREGPYASGCRSTIQLDIWLLIDLIFTNMCIVAIVTQFLRNCWPPAASSLEIN